MTEVDIRGWTKVIIGLAAVVLVAASGICLYDSHLKETFKCGACRVRAAHLTDGRRSVGLASKIHAPGGRPGTPVARVGRILAAHFAPRPVLVIAAPNSRPPCADALGVSAPKRRRWALCGGHGRNGAG